MTKITHIPIDNLLSLTVCYKIISSINNKLDIMIDIKDYIKSINKSKLKLYSINNDDRLITDSNAINIDIIHYINLVSYKRNNQFVFKIYTDEMNVKQYFDSLSIYQYDKKFTYDLCRYVNIEQYYNITETNKNALDDIISDIKSMFNRPKPQINLYVVLTTIKQSYIHNNDNIKIINNNMTESCIDVFLNILNFYYREMNINITNDKLIVDRLLITQDATLDKLGSIETRLDDIDGRLIKLDANQIATNNKLDMLITEFKTKSKETDDKFVELRNELKALNEKLDKK